MSQPSISRYCLLWLCLTVLLNFTSGRDASHMCLISLGYVVSSSPSSSTASGSRTVFVPQSEKGNKGMKSKTDLANSKSFVRPQFCHHCGVSGHIRPNYFKRISLVRSWHKRHLLRQPISQSWSDTSAKTFKLNTPYYMPL